MPKVRVFLDFVVEGANAEVCGRDGPRAQRSVALCLAFI
ncbi:hypothetical protein AKJ08_0257 [Vulgatibacter incomptus]|uniref:Uncharacterized protein n=1 Tax=Vulgatibacter incomptus TaxID=1391653 RepID=A0A0K1P8M2_9BACT|nr:hypothetical protein AKJ08_0257 [Vulgatibacter incomptus]